jgi:hypothetical protein
MSAREVPGFLDSDPKLLQLKNWPKRRRIDGRECELHVTNACLYGPRSVMLTMACYVCQPRWWWGKSQSLGPSYTWTPEGYVLERTSSFPGDRLLYQLDRAGRLAGFEDWKHGTTEYFDADGVLIAGEYAQVGLDKSMKEYQRGLVSTWLGDRVTHEEFVKRRAKLFRDMAWRY